MLVHLAHAAVAVLLIMATIWVLQKTGIAKTQEPGHHRWDWSIFVAVFVVMVVLNMVWPF